MATPTVDLFDRYPASISEVRPDFKETPSTSPSGSVSERIKVMKELFPWWFADHSGVMEPARPNSTPPASDTKEKTGTTMRNILKITHFISFSGEHLPATAENYAADVTPYSAVAEEMVAKAALSTNNPHDRNAYALQAGMYARRAAHNALRAEELGFRFPELTA
jgi:hypothetical protein